MGQEVLLVSSSLYVLTVQISWYLVNIDIYQMPAEESPAAALRADTLKAFRLQRSMFQQA